MYLNEHYTQFTNELSVLLTKWESNNTDVLIAGDYNINLLDINNKQVISNYFDTIISHSFYPKITLPTRLTNSNGTLIDNILCKLTETSLDTTSGILLDKIGICDHQACFTILNNITLKDSFPFYIKVNKQDTASLNGFINHLTTSQTLKSLNDTLNLDPNINYNILHDTIQTAKNI